MLVEFNGKNNRFKIERRWVNLYTMHFLISQHLQMHILENNNVSNLNFILFILLLFIFFFNNLLSTNKCKVAQDNENQINQLQVLFDLSPLHVVGFLPKNNHKDCG